MQIKGDHIVCNIFHHVACFGCGKGIATTYEGAAEARKMARQAGAKKMFVGDGNIVKQWYCKSCAAEHRVQLTGGQAGENNGLVALPTSN